MSVRSGTVRTVGVEAGFEDCSAESMSIGVEVPMFDKGEDKFEDSAEAPCAAGVTLGRVVIIACG
jgi:hypothetical protein